MNNLIDAHCHLSARPCSFNAVTGFICNSVTESDWLTVLNVAATHNNIYPAIGIHPWYVSDVTDGWAGRLYKLLTRCPSAMIGECGLDKIHPDYHKQNEIFKQHLEFAAELHRVIHIHCVRAWDDVFKMLKQFDEKIPAVVLHGFGGTDKIVARFSQMPNVYFSYGRDIMNMRRTKLQKALQITPKNRILIESDLTIAESENILPQIAVYISQTIGINTDEIYKNTMEILENGQIA